MKQVRLFTDGACSGNPGPGGWAAILQYQNHQKELVGKEDHTTNNRMELIAVIQGLKALREPCRVMVYSDSKYIIDAISKGWLAKWEANGWVRNKKDPVKNIELWQSLFVLLQKHKAEFIWVKGHSGHPENERCDQLATAQYH